MYEVATIKQIRFLESLSFSNNNTNNNITTIDVFHQGGNMTQDQPSRLDNLEAALGRFAEITIQNVLRHDEAIARHDEALFRMEGTIIDLGTRMDHLSSQVEAMTTSTTELVRSIAEMAVQANRDRLQNEALHAQHRA